MAFGKEKIKEFLEGKTEKISEKIEKTPIDKFFLFFLILITISALVLGYLQFKKNLESPLADSYLREKRGQLRDQYGLLNLINGNENTNQNLSQADIDKLKSQDSDLDGLNDYEEIYIYHTNAYNEDTDGDGLSDKQEVLNNTDPNCAQGQDCTALQTAGTVTSAGDNINTNQDSSASQPDLASLDQNAILNLETQLLSGEITLQDLGIDDPELQNTFDQIRNGQATDLSQLQPEEKSAAIETLKNLTPQQIRDELIKQGMSEADLDKIDDQTLQKVFLDTIGKY
ncbi:MAG: thrombospondin type 3 repeat-containing protein [Patescibacteria group bacterium]